MGRIKGAVYDVHEERELKKQGSTCQKKKKINGTKKKNNSEIMKIIDYDSEAVRSLKYLGDCNQ